MRMRVFKLGGQDCGEPSSCFDQSNSRISCRVSPLPTSQSPDIGNRAPLSEVSRDGAVSGPSRFGAVGVFWDVI
jgi:hypothetical protein